MKHPVIQPMRVTRADGSMVTTCCGPAALRAMRDGAKGYTPVGAARRGRCCHTA